MRAGAVTTATLHIAYEEYGDPGAPTVVLLHGWPDDVRTWDAIAPELDRVGFHVVVPYLRGFGDTRFLSEDTTRSGQIAALTADLIDLVDALGLDTFAVVGHDWGARAAYLAAALHPDRLTACAALSVGWGTNSPDQHLSLRQTQNYWYHWLFALPRGEDLIRNQRHELTEYIWRIWSPEADPADVAAAFAETAGSVENPDWAAVTLHSYRSRWGLAPLDPTYAEIEAAAECSVTIGVPTLVLHGGDDPCNGPDTSAGRDELFTAGYRRVVIAGAGHFPQRTAPRVVCDELVAFLAAHR